MAYAKQVWQDRVTEHPLRRKLHQVGIDPDDGSLIADIERDQGTEYESGTPINAQRLNHMEEGIYANQFPEIPGTGSGADGTYTLKCTVTGGLVSYMWVKDTTDGT